jgi:hypothetical protein
MKRPSLLYACCVLLIAGSPFAQTPGCRFLLDNCDGPQNVPQGPPPSNDQGAEVICDSPSMLGKAGPISPNQHCRRVAGTPAYDSIVPGPWEAQTGGACRAYSGIYQERRVYWRKCSE